MGYRSDIVAVFYTQNRAKKSYEVTVVLAERDGEQVVHTAGD